MKVPGPNKEPDLLGERVPGLSEGSLLLAQSGTSSHGRQQRDDGTPLFTEGHHEGLEDLGGERKGI